MDRLVMATNNRHKLDEVRAILSVEDLEIVGLDAFPDLPEPPEDHDTFEANALQKARFVFERTGLWTVADDSGIEVRALGWKPGVHSKRWTPSAQDEANNTKLLVELASKDDRMARYRCVLALVTDRGAWTAEGTCEGVIGFHARGAGGFGYDPYFLPDAYPGRTMAEVSMAEKNAVSHRGQAFRQLPALLARAR